MRSSDHLFPFLRRNSLFFPRGWKNFSRPQNSRPVKIVRFILDTKCWKICYTTGVWMIFRVEINRKLCGEHFSRGGFVCEGNRSWKFTVVRVQLSAIWLTCLSIIRYFYYCIGIWKHRQWNGIICFPFVSLSSLYSCLETKLQRTVIYFPLLRFMNRLTSTQRDLLGPRSGLGGNLAMASRAAARALSSASASATAAAAAAVSLGSSNCLLDLHLHRIPSIHSFPLLMHFQTT